MARMAFLEGAPYFPRRLKTDSDYEELPEPGVHGLFLTHARHDHDGNVPYLSPRIPTSNAQEKWPPKLSNTRSPAPQMGSQ